MILWSLLHLLLLGIRAVSVAASSRRATSASMEWRVMEQETLRLSMIHRLTFHPVTVDDVKDVTTLFDSKLWYCELCSEFEAGYLCLGGAEADETLEATGYLFI